MIKRKVINSIISWLSSNNAIEKKESEKYRYILEVIWIMLMPFLMMVPISILMNLTYEGFIVLLSFSLLRRVCGGFHFSKEITCYIFSSFLLINVILIGKNINSREHILILMAASFFSICTLSPICATKCNTKKIIEILFVNLVVCIMECVLFMGGKLVVAKWVTMGSTMTAVLQYPLVLSKLLTLRNSK